MKKYHLIISQNNQIQQVIALNPKKPAKLKAKANTHYKIYDEEGKVIHDTHLKFVGDDVHVYLPNESEVALVLENYQNYTIISNIAELTNLNTTLATTTPIASGVSISTLATGLTGLGVAVLGASTLKKNDKSPTNKTEAEQLAKEQAEKERQEKEHLEKEQAEKEAKAKAEAEKQAQEQAEKERLEQERLEKERQEREQAEKEKAEKEQTDKLAKEQAEKEKAEADRIAKEKAEQEAKEKAEKEKAEADELTKNPPKITFNNITEDNIINLSESQATLAVTGTVTNSKTGDVLTVTIGSASQTVTITDGKFTLNLNGKTLIVHNEISATLSRNGKDIGTTAHSYQVDTEIEKPTINFNNIADDNVINLKESEGKVTVSGTVENAKDGDEITLSCGCPSCTGVEWVDIKTTIQNGTFSVDFNGSDMVGNGRNIIKASVTTADDAKNTATGTAEKSYGVDITPPEPSFVYEKIGENGVINRKIAENNIVLRGKVINLGENETVAVKVVVNGQDFVATKNGDYYQVAIASGEFASGQAVRWHLTAKDKAGNEKIIEQNQSYTYDVTLNNPTVEIATNNQIINNQSKGLALSGSLNFDADVVQSSVKVDILLNNQTHSATVNGKAWTVSLPENIAKQNQGDNDFVVKVSVRDNAGNVAENQSVGKFTVDTLAPQVQITLNPIGEIAQTGAEKVALSGTVSGEFKPTDKVKVSVNGTEFVANIAQNGTFSVEVPRTALIQNASKSLSASLETTDTAGNIGTATIEQNYTVGTVVTPPNTPKPISIQLDSLTSDDLINVTESKQATSKISGTVANADGQTVAIKIGEQTHNAQVQNGKFSLNINTQELIQNASGKIVATVGGQTIERAYAVDDFATSQLQITEIGEHFQVFSPNDTVQFTGKVDLSGGILGKWNNASFINSIQATLNGKTYLVGLNADKTFTLNIPLDEVKQATGQGFTFSLPENRFSVYDLKSGRYSDSPMDYTAEYARLDDQSKYQLNDNPLFNNGKIIAPQTDLTAISGVVRGKATVGDTVVVQVGEHRHESQVEQGDKGLIFRVNVPTEQLLGVANETVSATLFGRDWQNKDYEISVLAKYEIGNADDKFVVTHPLASTSDIATDPKAPYFVQAMAFSVTQGHLLKHPIGQNETAHLTYQFRPSSGSETTFNESNREATRNGLKMLEKYANIKFKEVGENEKADIGYIMTDGGSANGFADYGGSVWLNGRLYQQNDYAGLTTRKGYMTMIHETLHSLGAKHPFEGRAKFPSEENDKMVSFMNYVNKFNDAKLELPMYDLLYLHYRYGVNKTARTENNTYKFNAFNPNAVDGDVYVWDGGGVDTFDASDQKQGVTVDLTPGSWVHSGAKSQNFLVDSVKTWNAQTFFNNQSAGRNLSEIYLDDKTPTYTTGQAFIGYGTQIERLIGSDFSDSLKGNLANNDIYGNDGNDTIFGDAGNDYLDGGKGADALSGGLGNDIFVVDDVGDQVFENADEGTDTVYAHIDYTLGDNVENLTLFGTASKGVGNALDNRMIGNGQANTLTGGGGKDTFVFNDVLDGNVDTISDFTVGVDKIELNPFAFVGLTAENLAERIAYDSKTGHLTYDPDGSGKADVIHFATLANKPNLTVDGNHFVLSSAENGFVPPSKPTTPNNPPSNPAPAEIQFNAITDDNIINRDEMNTPTITLSGSLENVQAGDVLTVKIGSVTKTVEIQGNGFTFNLDGKTLAVHQAISAELTRNGAKIAETTHAYRVDTEIDTPEITFRPITDDNTINLLESRNKINVSGTVKGVKDGDEITISCGCPTCTGVEWVDIKTTVQNGGFSVDFNGSDMVANRRTVVKASVTTSDDAKNTATGTAQQSYDVDITPPEPSFVYDEIGNKGVINREIAQNNIVLKGKIANLGENETVAVKVVVNGKDYTATKNGDVYQATVASGEFANGQAVKWHLTARDKAGNEKIIEQNQSYIYDVALSEPTISIANNNQTVNSQSKGLTLSGSLNVDDDVSSVKVDILLNNQTYSANVNAESKTWTVSLPENIVKQHQGDNAFTVKISVADTAGNVAQNQSVGKFMVDTVAPQVQITLNDMGEIQANASGNVPVSGKVTGEFKPSDTVKIAVNGTHFVANIGENGTFSTEIPLATLALSANRKVSASLETTDTAGNIGTATSEQNYTVPNGNNNANNSSNNPNQNQAVQLDKITSDDVINVTESKIATTKITGTASGADGQTVTLRFGDKTATATVQNGKFSVDINTQDLVENQSGKMIATLGGKTIERAYSVDNFASAQIKISEMAEIAPSEMVRLTGKVKLEGLFAQYQNPIQLQSFVATLNGKEYAVAVNTQDQTFAWNISLADLQAAKGQEISFVNKGGLSLYYVENGYARYKPIPNLDKSAYEFDDNPYVANGAVKSTLPTAETLIKGTVSGSAKVGDTVTLNIGNETVNATVQDGLRFAVAVDNAVLKQADKISATWSGQNHQGQNISVNTEHAYQTGSGSLKGDFVTKFVAQSESELPYIIKGLESYHKQDGYLKRFPNGEGATITYSFNKEYYQARDWTIENRTAVREALDVYEKYADIKFVALPDNSGVNTTDGKGRADIEFHHRPLGSAAGRAEFGGNVYISTSHNNMGSRTGFHTVMHEIGHSLGMKHTHETPNQMNYAEDHTGLSVMSYQGTNMNVNRWDLRMYDIAFVQYRYGVNKTQRAGNDTYTFKAFNPQSPDGDIYIWDGAGVDTFDASKEKLGVTVDLTPGSWIHRGEKAEHLAIKSFVDLYTSTFFTGHEGYVNDDLILINGKLSKFEYTDGQAFIGYGTQIERLIGSEHADSLKGNIADNEIFGGAGDDLIDGRDGNDYLDGGLGNDTIHGGKGDDIFVVDNANDVVVENYLEGIDTVHSYAHSYTLSPNVENISLFGVAEIAIGNDLGNRITGNELSNTLTGGAGADTFVFSNLLNGSVDTITDFNVSEDSIALTLSVFDNLTKDNIKDHIKYDSQTGALSYDKDGAGVADSIQFAMIGAGLNETQIMYHIIG